MSFQTKSSSCAIILLLILPLAASHGFQQNAGDRPTSREAWLDSVVQKAMEEYNIPGAVVALTTPSGQSLLRGYGYADFEEQRPMNPESTMLPVASVSKIYVAAAVLELAHRGSLQLDDDVLDHIPDLDFRGRYDDPLQLDHLLTHTAGFDETNLDRYVPLEQADTSVREYLIRSIPPRIRPPGIIYQYSNHGMALAGLAAEEASSTPFPILLERIIFAPLGMSSSSMRSDVPRNARGYMEVDGQLIPMPPHYVRTAYSGMLVSTAEDQLTMMNALLTGRHLSEKTIRGLMTRQFSHDSISPGTAYALFEDSWVGKQYFWHEGQTQGFYAGFYVVPEQGLGLFVAYNRHRGAFARVLRSAFLERELGPRGAETDLDGEGASPDMDLSDFESTYRFVRHAHSGPERILSSLLGRAGEIDVAIEGPKTLRIGYSRFVHAGEQMFVEPETGAINGFISGSDGRPQYVYYQRSAFERISLLETEELRDGWIALSLILYGLSLILWLIASARSSLSRKSIEVARHSGWMKLPAVVLQFLFFLGLLLIAGSFRGDEIFGFLFPWPAWMHGVFVLPWLAVATTPFLAWEVWVIFRTVGTRWYVRLHYAFLFAFSLLFIVFAIIWRIL